MLDAQSTAKGYIRAKLNIVPPTRKIVTDSLLKTQFTVEEFDFVCGENEVE